MTALFTRMDPKKAMPLFGKPVLCELKHADSSATQEHMLVRVDEEDVAWRTAAGLHEISYDWDVLSWRYPDA